MRVAGAPEKARLADVFPLVCDPALSDGAVRLWSLYRKYHIDERGAYLGDETAANELGWSVRKVEDKRAELVEHQCLLVVLRGPAVPARYPLPHPNGSRQRGGRESHQDVTHGQTESHLDVTEASHADVTHPDDESHDDSHHGSQQGAGALRNCEPGNRRSRSKASRPRTTGHPNPSWSGRVIDTWRECAGSVDKRFAGRLVSALKIVNDDVQDIDRLCYGLARFLLAGKGGFGPEVFARDWRKWVPGGTNGIPSLSRLAVEEFVSEVRAERGTRASV